VGEDVLVFESRSPRRHTRKAVVLAAILSAAAFAGLLGAPHVVADQGAPDACGYSWTDSNDPAPKVAFNWIEIHDNGTRIGDTDWVGNSDDGYYAISLGFGFPFYGAASPPSTQAFVGTNGYVSFGHGYAAYVLPPIPDPAEPNNAAYAFGIDLRTQDASGEAGVYFLQGGSPDWMVIEYYRVPVYGTTDVQTFEVVLRANGDVWFQYLSLTNTPRVVGIENADGSTAVPYYGALSDSLAIRFSPPAAGGAVGVALAPCSQGMEVRPATSVDAPLNATNTGTGTDTFEMTFGSPSGWNGTFYESDGATPLPDSDGDSIPDTGALTPGGSADMVLRVDVPSGASGTEFASVTATSSADANVSDTAVVQYRVPSAFFTPPHFDHGVDTNGNGQFDYLVLDVNFTATTNSTFFISGTLHDPANNLYLSTYNLSSPGIGPSAVSMYFDGRQINASQIDGPYLVDLDLFDLNVFALVDNGTHTTRAYSHLDFEAAPAHLAPPHYDRGVDTNGNGLFDLLNVNVSVQVQTPDWYDVQAFLHDPTDTVTQSNYTMAYLPVGLQTMTVSFVGWQLNGGGIDGPYDVQLSLFASSGFVPLGQDTHVTQAYDHNAFERPPSIPSAFATTPPTIDGAIVGTEWSTATILDLSTIPNNALPAYMYVENDNTMLYVAYDAVGDQTQDAFDGASLAFDTGNDAVPTAGHEDQFVQGGWAPNDQAHYVYDSSYGTWLLQDSPYDTGLPNEAGLASAWGFGPSPFSGVDHGIYEFAIPLALLGASPGDVLGLFAGSQAAPGVVDGATFTYSLWPVYGYGPAQMFAYGDLFLGRDTTLPTLSITSPTGGTLVGVDAVTVSWSASDLGGLDHIDFALDGGPAVHLPATATSYTATGLTDGLHIFDVTAFDRAGNTASASTFVRVDTIPPSVTIATPSDSEALGSATVLVHWFSADANGVDHFEVSLDGGTSVRVNSAIDSTDFTGVSDGTHTVNVTAYDNAGHAGSDVVSFTVDTAPPTVTVSNPAQGSVVTASSATLRWTGSDATSGIDHFDVSLDGGSPQSFSATTTSFVLSGLADGSHTVTVLAYDRAGNSAMSTVSFRVDTAVLSPSGPYGSAVILGIVAAVVVAALAAIFLMRRRKRAPPPSGGPSP